MREFILSRRVVVFLLGMSLLLLSQGRAVRAESELDFQLFNRTGVDIARLHIAPSDSEDWGDDVVDGTLMNEADVAVKFHPKATAELWDIRIEDASGNSLVWKQINLKETAEVILEPNGKARLK